MESERNAGCKGQNGSEKQHRQEHQQRRTLQRQQHAELMSSLSTLYAKLLVVVGVAVPVTASVSQQVPAALDKVKLILQLRMYNAYTPTHP